MSPGSPPKMFTRGPLWSFCVALTSRGPRASAVVDTWPTMKWRSSCSCQTLSRCRSQSPQRSTSTARRASSKWPASKVEHTNREYLHVKIPASTKFSDTDRMDQAMCVSSYVFKLMVIHINMTLRLSICERISSCLNRPV